MPKGWASNGGKRRGLEIIRRDRFRRAGGERIKRNSLDLIIFCSLFICRGRLNPGDEFRFRELIFFLTVLDPSREPNEQERGFVLKEYLDILELVGTTSKHTNSSSSSFYCNYENHNHLYKAVPCQKL